MSKEITIAVPDGKRAEWINGVLTLVDEQKVDNRPVTERIKTLTDACNALGDEHPLVTQYRLTAAAYKGEPMTEDLIAYLKLRVIVAALNDGWEPKFDEVEYRYYPWFYILSEKEYARLSEEEKGRVVSRSNNNAFPYGGLVCTGADDASSHSYTVYGTRLVFKTRELAKYAGEQFTQEWADFVFRSESKVSETDRSNRVTTINF